MSVHSLYKDVIQKHTFRLSRETVLDSRLIQDRVAIALAGSLGCKINETIFFYVPSELAGTDFDCKMVLQRIHTEHLSLVFSFAYFIFIFLTTHLVFFGLVV